MPKFLKLNNNPLKINNSLLRSTFPWTPEEISTYAWWDASDLSTITESGGAVSQLDDKSNNSRDATQTFASGQPETGTRTINGLNALDFVSDILNFPENVEHPTNNKSIIAAVVDYDVASDSMLVDQNGGQWGLGIYGSNYIYYHDGVGLDIQKSGTATGIQILIGYYDGTDIAVGSNFSYATQPQSFTAPTGTIYTATLGRGLSRNFNGSLGELVMINDYTEDMRLKLEGYLAWKWGFTANLPSDHLYKNRKPFG